jgi:hypothetical protein
MNKVIILVEPKFNVTDISFNDFNLLHLFRELNLNNHSDIETNICGLLNLENLYANIGYNDLQVRNENDILKDIVINKDRTPILIISPQKDPETAFKYFEDLIAQIQFDLVNVDDIFNPNIYLILTIHKLCPHSKADSEDHS